MCFSFFYVRQIANYGIDKNALYKEINDYSTKMAMEKVDAKVNGEYIIPGLNGKNINIKKSYYNMRSSNNFDTSLLVYDDIKPVISIDNNKDKIINKGNSLKNQISFIVNNKTIQEYMLINRIKGDILVTYDELNKESFFEQINNDINKYNKVDKFLKSNNLNNNLCFYNTMIETLCRVHNKYLIEYTYSFNNVNIAMLKKEVKPGNIYYVEPSVTLDDFIILIREIKFKNINIVYLSELIKEQRD